MSEIKDIVVQGLWKNNSALVQLLGLCPLLAVTSTATNALGLGLATTLVLTLTNLTVSALRRWTPAEIRIPIYVMIIASVVSAVQMLIMRMRSFVSVFRDFYSADCNELHCCRSRRSVCREKRTVAFRVGRFFHRHGRDRRDVRAGFAARDPREWYAFRWRG